MKIAIIASILYSSAAAAGSGMGGGTPPAIRDVDTLALMSLSLEQLPKAYAEQEDLRRAAGRLSVAGTEITDLTVDGTSIKVRKLRDSIVDEKVSKKILSQ